MTYDSKKYIEIIIKRRNGLPAGYNLYEEDKEERIGNCLLRTRAMPVGHISCYSIIS